MKENDTRISLINNDMTLVFTVLKPEDSGYYECIAENRVAKEIKAIEIDVLSKYCYYNIYSKNVVDKLIKLKNCVGFYFFFAVLNNCFRGIGMSLLWVFIYGKRDL